MNLEILKQKILAGFEKADVEVSGEGCHCRAVVISDEFTGMKPLARQRKILAAVDDDIKSGALHALTIKAYTCNEYKNA